MGVAITHSVVFSGWLGKFRHKHDEIEKTLTYDQEESALPSLLCSINGGS